MAFESPRWAQRKRLEFIQHRLDDPGWINRANLIAEFEISPAQCAKDFAMFRRLFPDVMAYDVVRKAYVPAGTPPASVKYLARGRVRKPTP